jgi:predicted MFS family arabinose efflux permease
LAALITVTPQVILPLLAQLALPDRRTIIISIVSGGLFTSKTFVRIVLGVITEYESWRIVYWVSFAIQYLILILLFLFFPDYPSVNAPGKAIYS